MKKRRKPKEFPDGKQEISPELRRELKRRIADADNPVRYVVFSDITGDGYGTSIDQATLFKREHVARSVAKAYSEGRRNDLLIAKITTKNGKRKVLKYHKLEHRTSGSRRRGKPRITDT